MNTLYFGYTEASFFTCSLYTLTLGKWTDKNDVSTEIFSQGQKKPLARGKKITWNTQPGAQKSIRKSAIPLIYANTKQVFAAVKVQDRK